MPTTTPLEPQGRGLTPIYSDGPTTIISPTPSLTSLLTPTPTPTIMPVSTKVNDALGVFAVIMGISIILLLVAIAGRYFSTIRQRG